MTSTMSRPFSPAPAARPAATVLVATDGAERSDGAVRLAFARATELGAQVEVLAVHCEEPLLAPEMSYAMWSEAGMARRKALSDAVRAQLERVAGGTRVPPVLVLDGNPAYTIARAAMERRAALVVVGLGRHQVMDRLFSSETTLELARICRVPVLAAPAGGADVPRHAVVAIDFSELSARAAQAAIEAVGDAGTVQLVHVMARVPDDARTAPARPPYERWLEGELAAVVRRLAVPPGIRVGTAILYGKPAPEIIAYAARSRADLIVTGTHGRGFVARAILGSVTSQLLRTAACPVLTVPRDALPSFAATPDVRDTMDDSISVAEGSWAGMLNAFTVRNAGRRTILEVDDLDIGAQAQEHNYPLIAAMYDLHERRLQLMLGDRRHSGRHLSRSIGGVSAVDVLTDGAGRDVALRIGQESGQTLLTFASTD